MLSSPTYLLPAAGLQILLHLLACIACLGRVLVCVSTDDEQRVFPWPSLAVVVIPQHYNEDNPYHLGLLISSLTHATQRNSAATASVGTCRLLRRSWKRRTNFDNLTSHLTPSIEHHIISETHSGFFLAPPPPPRLTSPSALLHAADRWRSRTLRSSSPPNQTPTRPDSHCFCILVPL